MIDRWNECLNAAEEDASVAETEKATGGTEVKNRLADHLLLHSEHQLTQSLQIHTPCFDHHCSPKSQTQKLNLLNCAEPLHMQQRRNLQSLGEINVCDSAKLLQIRVKMIFGEPWTVPEGGTRPLSQHRTVIA